MPDSSEMSIWMAFRCQKRQICHLSLELPFMWQKKLERYSKFLKSSSSWSTFGASGGRLTKSHIISHRCIFLLFIKSHLTKNPLSQILLRNCTKPNNIIMTSIDAGKVRTLFSFRIFQNNVSYWAHLFLLSTFAMFGTHLSLCSTHSRTTSSRSTSLTYVRLTPPKMTRRPKSNYATSPDPTCVHSIALGGHFS